MLKPVGLQFATAEFRIDLSSVVGGQVDLSGPWATLEVYFVTEGGFQVK